MKKLKIILLSLYCVSSLYIYSDVPLCIYDGPEESNPCIAGTKAYIEKISKIASNVISGEFVFVEGEMTDELLTKKYSSLVFNIEKTYKGFLPAPEVKILVSNAVLNYPNTNYSRGEVADILKKKSGNYVASTENFISELKDKGLEETEIFQEYSDIYQQVIQFSKMHSIFMDGTTSPESRELVIYPNKKYILFLLEIEGAFALSTLSDQKALYEYSEELNALIESYKLLEIKN